MARYLIISFLFLTISCKSTDQLIKINKDHQENITFDAVTKTLKFNEYEQSQLNFIGEQLIYEWFNNKIKTDGLEGSLEVIVTKLETETQKKDDYFKVIVNLSLNFNQLNNNLINKKSFNISTSEFSEISGKFSILDQENLSINTFMTALKKITIELNNLN